jgi:hypothetical protein
MTLLLPIQLKLRKGTTFHLNILFLWIDLNLHGLNSIFDQKLKAKIVFATRYKFKEVKFSETPYEGRQTVTFNYDTYEEEVIIPKGSYFYLTDQPAARILTHLLEPKSNDSFVRWGFMNQIFEQKEYYEDYVMEKLAEKMLMNDSELRREFEEKLKSDEDFRNNSRARLDFFYERSLYPDKQLNVYPILRIEK